MWGLDNNNNKKCTKPAHWCMLLKKKKREKHINYISGKNTQHLVSCKFNTNLKKSRTFFIKVTCVAQASIKARLRVALFVCVCVCVCVCYVGVCVCVCYVGVCVCFSLVAFVELVTREGKLVFMVQISLQPLVLLQREHSVMHRRKTYVINYLFPLTLPSFRLDIYLKPGLKVKAHNFGTCLLQKTRLNPHINIM